MIRDLTVSTLRPRKYLYRTSPPFNRIPAWEKNFWGIFMFCGIMAYPFWVVYHLPDYRGGVNPHIAYIKMAQRKADAEAAKEA